MTTSVQIEIRHDPLLRTSPRPHDRWRDWLVLTLVAVLPLHTLYLDAWVAWKPFMVLLAALVALDAREAWRTRSWPWDRVVSSAAAIFLGTALLGWPASPYLGRFARLFLALVTGVLVLLVTARHLRRPGMAERALRVVFWSGAAMAVTGFLVSLVAVGVYPPLGIPEINRLPGIDRVAKMVYLEEGFQALTNWHQDPGYAASWMTLWGVLGLVASVRGLGTRWWWADAAVLGGLSFGVLMTFSRTGWAALVVALGLAGALLARRGGVPLGAVAKRMVVAVLVVVLLVGVTWTVDDPDAGSHLWVQFDFRLGQAWDAVAGFFDFATTDTAFAAAFDASEERAVIWPQYLALFREHPATGVGLGVGWATNPHGQEPHNLLLELLAETGLVGLAGFLLLVGAVIRRGRGLAGGLAVAVALLPAITQTVLFEVSWWFAAGLLLAGTALFPGERGPLGDRAHH